jgi:N-acetylglucosamine-6-phosphate deacetylase
MRSLRLRARHYRSCERLDVLCQDGVVAAVGPADAEAADLEAGWIAPALFDLQINGGSGIAFGSHDLSVDQVRQVVEQCRRHGVASLCPTLITGPFEALAHGFATLQRACESSADLARALPCFHLEGPYISPVDGPRGAHPSDQVRPPDWDEFLRLQEAAGGRIRLVTLAPETPGGLDFIEWLAAQGVVVAIGHTAAVPATIRAAVAAGARLSTHLGNGSHALLPRHENYLWEQLADDRLWASLITDGHHLPANVVRCIVRVKTPARLIVTCDASSLAGLPPGRYRAWDQDLEVHAGGKVVVTGTPFLAGSGAFTDHCLRFLLSLGEVSLAEALDMACARPRELLGLPPARIEPGNLADLILFEHDQNHSFHLRATIVAGRLTSVNTNDPLSVQGT